MHQVSINRSSMKQRNSFIKYKVAYCITRFANNTELTSLVGQVRNGLKLAYNDDGPRYRLVGMEVQTTVQRTSVLLYHLNP